MELILVQVSTINEMRRMAGDRGNAFGRPIVTLAAGAPEGEGNYVDA
jgi:hypothetical protein